MAFEKGQIVLLDTNVILEAHRTNCWAALADFYCLETVEKCIEETQTGFQNREPEHTIDSASLRRSLRNIHNVTDADVLKFVLDNESAATLDAGEQHLLIHASHRQDAWVVSSPDKAAMRFIHERGWIARLISLESIINRISARTSQALRVNFTENWMSQKRTQMLMS